LLKDTQEFANPHVVTLHARSESNGWIVMGMLKNFLNCLLNCFLPLILENINNIIFALHIEIWNLTSCLFLFFIHYHMQIFYIKVFLETDLFRISFWTFQCQIIQKMSLKIIFIHFYFRCFPFWVDSKDTYIPKFLPRLTPEGAPTARSMWLNQKRYG